MLAGGGGGGGACGVAAVVGKRDAHYCGTMGPLSYDSLLSYDGGPRPDW